MYYEYFGLEKDPFTLTPDIRFYCYLPSHNEALETILYTIESGQSFCLIYGEVGVGKTMLCRKLIDKLDEKKVCSCFIFNPNTPLEALQAALMAELGVESLEDQGAAFEKINKKLLQNADEGVETVLIIDEGQALSDEGLEFVRTLTNLETASRKLLQIIVFAQPELLDRIQQPHLRQLAQRFAQTCELLPLGKLRMKSYVSERLVSAGHKHGQFISARAMRKLWQHTHGNPRLINSLMSKALLSAYSSEKTQIKTSDVCKAVKESKLLFCHDKKHLSKAFKWAGAIIFSYALCVTIIVILSHFGWVKTI